MLYVLLLLINLLSSMAVDCVYFLFNYITQYFIVTYTYF